MQNIIRLIISMQLFVALCHGDLVYEFYSANTLMRVEITDETYGVIVANPGGTFARRVTGTDTFVALTQAELDDLVLPPPIPPEPEPLLAIYANAAAQVEAQAPLLDDHPSAEDVPAPGMFYRLANEDDETIQELWYVRQNDGISSQLSAHDAEGNPINRTRNLRTGQQHTIHLTGVEAAVRRVVADTTPTNAAFADIKEVASVFPTWSPGIAVRRGEFYLYTGGVYRVIQAHTTQADWTPPTVPALFTHLPAPGESGYPPWVQPAGSHDAYQTGDIVEFNGTNYRSKINNNSWSPTAYPAGWEVVEQ